MDECDGLENRYTRKGIVGSNPTPSAKMQPTRPGPTVNPHPSLPLGGADRPIPLSFSPQARTGSPSFTRTGIHGSCGPGDVPPPERLRRGQTIPEQGRHPPHNLSIDF